MVPWSSLTVINRPRPHYFLAASFGVSLTQLVHQAVRLRCTNRSRHTRRRVIMWSRTGLGAKLSPRPYKPPRHALPPPPPPFLPSFSPTSSVAPRCPSPVSAASALDNFLNNEQTVSWWSAEWHVLAVLTPRGQAGPKEGDSVWGDMTR